MTVNTAIMRADELRPNAYSESEKTAWLSELDGKISLEIFKAEPQTRYTYSQDADRELLVSHPHEDIYPLYIAAMVDFYNQDVSSYQNAMSMFNNRYDIFAKWYQRSNVPKHGGGFRNLL